MNLYFDDTFHILVTYLLSVSWSKLKKKYSLKFFEIHWPFRKPQQLLTYIHVILFKYSFTMLHFVAGVKCIAQISTSATHKEKYLY